ncbi:MAG: GNAT family N-acetyltransferase [Candidatus Omnitrophota bacterium]
MQETKPSLAISILTSINDIPRQDWERLFTANIIENYGYHKALEESGLKGFSIFYLVAKRDNALVATIPFFIMDFSITTLIRGPLGKLIFSIRKLFKRFLMTRLIFVGSPTAEELYIGIAKEENKALILPQLFDKLYEFSRLKKIKTILFYNLTAKDDELKIYLRDNGFTAMEDLPTTRLEIKEKNLEEYISNLGSNTRKDLRRKLRKSAELVRLETEITDNIDNIIDEVYQLYTNSLNDSDLQFETLTRDFFQNICRNMPSIAKYFITRNHEKIVAFNLCFIKGDTCIDKFIGFDYSVASEYNLYYTTFCHNIDWCIKNNIRFYQPGQGDYDAKIRLGASLIPLFIYIKSFNPLLNLLMKPIIKAIEPQKFDPALKNLKKYKNLRSSL